MRQALLVSVLVISALLFPPATVVGDNERQTAQDSEHARTRRRLHANELQLDFFRRLTLGEQYQKQLGQLIQQLDGGTYKEREWATKALIAAGPAALPVLRRGLRNASLEVRLRLERCIKALDQPNWSDTIAAAAQGVKGQRTDNSVAVLLAFAPFAPDDAIDAVTNASWKQNGPKLYFEINNSFRETTGMIKNGVIQCEAWNSKGLRWSVTLKKLKQAG
jgi:hypothetical protein